MALTLKEAFQIKTVAAFEAADGTKFHSLGEAQDFTRRKMVEAGIETAIKANPQFARLDKPLLVDFLLMTGRHMGAVMAEPLAPTDPRYATGGEVKNISINAPGTISRDVAQARAEAMEPRREWPEHPLHTAKAVDVMAQESRAAHKARAAELSASDKPRWSEHAADAKPLTKAMANVDAEMGAQIEDDIANALRLGGH